MAAAEGAGYAGGGLPCDRERNANAQVRFKGHSYAADLSARVELLEAANLANASVRAGCRPGDLRWNHPARDFTWSDSSGVQVKMDAYMLLALAAHMARRSDDLRVELSACAQSGM